MDNLQLEIHRVGPLQTNCYFLINTDTMETLIVDPGCNATGLTKKLKNSGYRPVAMPGLLCQEDVRHPDLLTLHGKPLG